MARDNVLRDFRFAMIDQMIDSIVECHLILINVRGALYCLCASAQIQEDEVQQERSAIGYKGAEAAGNELTVLFSSTSILRSTCLRPAMSPVEGLWSSLLALLMHPLCFL